jgi:dihydrofolate reductase
MGRLIVSAQMTADAVMDQLESWFDPTRESETYGLDQLRAADALLLGRETYEHFSTVWPKMDGDPGGYADLVNGIAKFVVSRTLREPLTWNATLVHGDIATSVAELKRQHTGNLLSYGFGELAHYLARHGLIDEVRFWLHPVVWGDGLRPSRGGMPPVRMRLIGATTFSSGVVRLSYQPVRDHDGTLASS